MLTVVYVVESWPWTDAQDDAKTASDYVKPTKQSKKLFVSVFVAQLDMSHGVDDKFFYSSWYKPTQSGGLSLCSLE